MAWFVKRLLSLFLSAGLFGSQKAERDFLKRIEKGDIKYILERGVPSVEPPTTPGPRPWREPFLAEGFNAASILLRDPEALMNLLLASDESYDLLRLKGDGASILRGVAEYSRRNPARIIYLDAVPESKVEIRLLAAGGFVTALYLEAQGRDYVGVDAFERLQSLYWEDVAFTVTPLKSLLLQWSDEQLSVYVKGLDNQHKYLVNTLNSLYRATVMGEADKVVSTILSRLVDYTKFHFRSEEILMERYEYPQERYLRHVREHKAFVKATVQFREKYEAGEADLTVDVFKFLASWIRNHVAGTDRDYGRYFLEIGIANYTPQGAPAS